MCAEVTLRRQMAIAPVTAESPRDEPEAMQQTGGSSTDHLCGCGTAADSSSTDEEPEAMQVTAGSSTDQPGNTHAGSILPVGEEPMYLPSTTSLHQPTGTDMISQMVTTGSGPGDFDFRQDPFWARRHHLVTTGFFRYIRFCQKGTPIFPIAFATACDTAFVRGRTNRSAATPR